MKLTIVSNSGPSLQDKKAKKEPKNETYFTVKLTGLPNKVKKKDVKLFFKPLKPK